MSLIPRVFALLLVVSFLLPTVARATPTGADPHPFTHAFELVSAPDVGADPAQKGCCLECPQHAWYRHAEEQTADPRIKRVVRRLSFAFFDEIVRSSNVDPPREPPKA